MKLSVVIPCFNESEGIAQLRAQLDAARPGLDRFAPWELVLVDDGSTDDTYAQMTTAFTGWTNLRIVRHEKNRGLGAALRTGLAAAEGEVIVVTDSDGTYPYTTIPDLLALLGPDVDIVTSSALHPQGGIEGVPAYRLLLSKGASFLYRVLVSWRIHTYTAMYRAYRRDVARSVPTTSDGYLVMAELLVNALRRGYRVVEFPTVLHVRRFGQSKARIARIIGDHLRFQVSLIGRMLSGADRPSR